MEFKLHNGSGGLCCKSCGRQDKQLNTYDWLADIPGNADESELVEVQFKNTRKGYFRNSNKIPLEKGDIVAVEATPGHDIGVVTLTGRLVPLQMKKANIKSEADIKRIYRKAKPVDMEKYNEAKAREHSTMIRSRQIALDLNLNMKIGDVEYQGDGNKAIFYYIADERVDFRQLIKVLADAFRVRIEMKQIGARQEAGRIGGIGPCGRELCCATWMTSFVSVSTSAARFQDISLNPQKLAGQCAKLKCCLNYEVDCYVEAQKRLPSREITLETKDGEFFFFKADILSNQITYSCWNKRASPALTAAGKARVAVTATVARTATTAVTRERKRVETVVRKEVSSRVLRNPTTRENNPGKTGNRDRNKTGKHPNKVNSNKANVNNGTITTVVRPVTISPNLKVKDLPKMTNRLKNRNLCLKGIILLFVASLLSACDKQTVYHSFQSLPTEGWLREDTLSFDVKVTDSLTYYKLSLEVRNRSNYPYQNLPLSICYTIADSIPSPTDTIQLILADKEGIWKGDGWGGLYQTAVSAGSVQIGKPGTYLFKVAYTLPDERLQGINDIGIKLKR